MVANDKRVWRLVVAVKEAANENYGFLWTPRGKKLLKEAMALDLSWPQITKIFRRSQSRIEKACNFHGVKKQKPKYLSWTDDAREVIKDYYAKSKAVKSRAESALHTSKMHQAVNEALKKAGIAPKKLNAIRCFARDHALKWGWPTDNSWPDDEVQLLRKTIERLKGAASPEEENAIIAEFGSKVKYSSYSISRKLSELGFS